jgi:disulfide bond formation protein DsbB
MTHKTILTAGICAVGLFLAALFYQHMFAMPPCYKCIQQHSLLALSGLLLLIVWVNEYPTYTSKFFSQTRSLASIAGAFLAALSASSAYKVAAEHLRVAADEMSFLYSSCETTSPLPSWLPLDIWLPSFFKATGSCADDVARAFGIEMPVFVQVMSLILVLSAFYFLSVKCQVFLKKRRKI